MPLPAIINVVANATNNKNTLTISIEGAVPIDIPIADTDVSIGGTDGTDVIIRWTDVDFIQYNYQQFNNPSGASAAAVQAAIAALLTLPLSVPGKNGLFGGDSQLYTFDTSTSPSPSLGYIRFNNATPSAVTNLYINVQDFNSVNISAWLAALSNSTTNPYGRIRVFSEFDSSIFADFNITGAVVDNSTYYTVPVTYVTGNSTFTNNLNVVITFSRTGDKGSGTAPTPQTLTDSAAITWDTSLGINAGLLFTTAIGATRTLTITNAAAGQSYTLVTQQAATGGQTFTFTGITVKVAGGGAGAITNSTANNAYDMFNFYYDGTNFYCTYAGSFT